MMHTIFSKFIVNEDGFHYPEEGMDHSLVRSLNFAGIPAAELMSLPPEKIMQAYDDFANCQFSLLKKNVTPLQIACIVPGQPGHGMYIFRLIAALNQLPLARFSLYVHPSIVNEVAALSNEHITVLPFSSDENITIHTHLVITYGLRAIHFLRTGIPVFILGPNGLGGLVTTVNLPFLYQSAFMGRPGGYPGEAIPVKMVAHELRLFERIQDVAGHVEELATIAQSWPIRSLSEEKRHQQACYHQLMEIYTDTIRREKLVPKLCSNMQLVKASDAFAIQRTGVYDTLCVVDKEDAGFFNDIDGVHTCGAIREKHGMANELFWETIDVLLKKDIIIVSL